MTTTEPTPMTGPQASVYQQLRGHLAALKLPAAASTSRRCSPMQRPRAGR